MITNIRDDIVARRRERVKQRGHDEGAAVPERRAAPVVPFLGGDGLICEVKRRSPSRGDIAPGMDAAKQAALYVAAGARNLSVLTEPEGFGGSLDDLMRVKQAFPEIAVLRKDFLFDPEDIDTAWRAGADAVLLIAGMLDADRLRLLHERAVGLGMAALVELHDEDDLRKAAAFAPPLVGVNSRDLVSFRIDPLLPLRVKARISWDCRVVYESGISSPEQADFASASGFAGLLVGEAAVRDPSLPARLRRAVRAAVPARFWTGIACRQAGGTGAPLVKICGLAREEDARAAADLGADVLGFVFWPQSKRHADPSLLLALRDVRALKVGVTVNPEGGRALDPAIAQLLREGLLDAVQLHGDERPDDCAALWPVNYKALRPRSAEEMAAARAYRCPRVLLDAAADLPGGSGRRIPPEILAAWTGPLWLAGGITPDNVQHLAETYRPELVDVASGVEDAPGIKNIDKMKQFMKEVHHA